MEMTLEPRQTQESHLRAVRLLLLEWVRYRRRWKPENGYPKAVAWVNQVHGAVGWNTEDDEYDDIIRSFEMRHVDDSVKALPSECQHAIQVVYLREIGPAVWRSARKPMTEIVALCERAEVLLVPMLRRRDVI